MSGFIASLFWLLLFAGSAIYLAYNRVSLLSSTMAMGGVLVLYLFFGDWHPLWMLLLILLFRLLVIPNLLEFRRERITRPALDMYRTLLPSMSDTEKEALEAGNVWWDGELFSGMPDWDRLMSFPPPQLSEEEQAFLDGPCETLCGMLDDWDVAHERGDMAPEIWAFIKKHRFFAMIIPKQYGGLEFSAYANAMVIAKLASRNSTASSTVGVPNSLGPAELLLHYGTEEQKERWLPGLASGDEIPCFALTSPQAGSDAAALIDTGVVCKGTWQGKQITGIRLNWEKRYITLAPVATVLGLAFKLYDPDHLIGDNDEYGNYGSAHPDRSPGRRNRPAALPAQHPVPERADQRQRRVCAAGFHHRRAGDGRQGLENAGRTAVSRPGNHPPVNCCGRRPGRCLGVRRLHANTPPVQCAGREVRGRRRSARTNRGPHLYNECGGLRDRRRHRPGREAGRPIGDSQISLHRARPQGRQRYHGRSRRQGHHDGAEELCRPRLHGNAHRDYRRRRQHSHTQPDHLRPGRDDAVIRSSCANCRPPRTRTPSAACSNWTMPCFSHIGYAISNAARAFFLALTHAKFSNVPLNTPTRRYYQNVNRYSAAFALATDFAMLTLGGKLKIKELLSARLGDVLSCMYLASTVLKHFENQGRRAVDLPLVEWSVRTLMYHAQETASRLPEKFSRIDRLPSFCAASSSRAGEPTRPLRMTWD